MEKNKGGMRRLLDLAVRSYIDVVVVGSPTMASALFLQSIG